MSARRTNVIAKGAGVVRWLPWIAQFIAEQGWGQVSHGERLPGIDAATPVQVRQDLYGDTRWYVVSNAGVWGMSGFATADAAVRFARHVVIDADGSEYRRNAAAPAEEPGGEHLGLGHAAAQRVMRAYTAYLRLSAQLDAAYATGGLSKVDELEVQTERLLEELDGLYHELTLGDDQVDDRETVAEEELALLWATYVSGRLFAGVGGTQEETLLVRLRGLLQEYAREGAPITRLSDAELMQLAEGFYSERVQLIGRYRAPKAKPSPRLKKLLAKARRGKRRRNPDQVLRARVVALQRAVQTSARRPNKISRDGTGADKPKDPGAHVMGSIDASAGIPLLPNRFVVLLAAVRVPEAPGGGEHAPPTVSYGRTLAELSELVLKWTEHFDIGSTSYYAGGSGVVIDDTGAHVANVSYNGRVWVPGHYPTDEITGELLGLSPDEFRRATRRENPKRKAKRKRTPKAASPPPVADFTLTDNDVRLAAWGIHLLDTNALRVTLTRGEQGGMIRLTTSDNPSFYRTFVHRREKPAKGSGRAKPQTPGYRNRVYAALRRVVAREPYGRESWIGWELLELLHEQEQGEYRAMGVDPSQIPPSTPTPEYPPDWDAPLGG